jgi:hypothetical protein
MNEIIIEQIIDTCLQKWIDAGLNKLPMDIDPEMAGEKDKEGWTTWFPIDSKVTDAEIEDFEEQIGYSFPADYKRLLKHKHFYELNISEASFTHPANTWRRAHVGLIYEGYPREFLIDKGYLPFAGWSDWGVLCFDTNAEDASPNYPIVLWDHEMARKVTPVNGNFSELMSRLNQEESTRTFD